MSNDDQPKATPYFLALSVSISSEGADLEKPPTSVVHLVSAEQYPVTFEQAKHIEQVVVNLCRTWGMNVYRAEKNGEVIFDAEAPAANERLN